MATSTFDLTHTLFQVRASFKNEHGWGPTANLEFETAKHFAVLHSKVPVLVEGYLHTHIYEDHENAYYFDELISNQIGDFIGGQDEEEEEEDDVDDDATTQASDSGSDQDDSSAHNCLHSGSSYLFSESI